MPSQIPPAPGSLSPADPAAGQERRLLAALATLNELALAVSSSLDPDELVDRCSATVTRYLRFERVLVLLVDPETSSLRHGHLVGGDETAQAAAAALDLPIDRPGSPLLLVLHADAPLLLRELERDPDAANREQMRAMGLTTLLGTPLRSTAGGVGILAAAPPADVADLDRDLDPDLGPLLFTIGHLVGGGIETARLYATVSSHARELETRVSHRTVALADAVESAQAARAAAEAANATKSSFLANVSHELRTPLTSIVGFTKLIDRRLAEVVFPRVPPGEPKVDRAMAQVRDNLGIIAVESARLTGLINDVLDLAKIEAGRVEWRMAPLDVGQVVEQACAATAALFEGGTVQLERRVRPGLPAVIGDRDRLVQVVINLLSNAVKFTPTGTITVDADVALDGRVVEVAVHDTGIGIAEADQARVWEAFGQAGDTLPDAPRGTGLGLPISRHIVEHHGGEMWLVSAPDAGSTFAFRLPVANADATPRGNA